MREGPGGGLGVGGNEVGRVVVLGHRTANQQEAAVNGSPVAGENLAPEGDLRAALLVLNWEEARAVSVSRVLEVGRPTRRPYESRQSSRPFSSSADVS